jgi:hypothetical protein
MVPVSSLPAGVTIAELSLFCLLGYDEKLTLRRSGPVVYFTWPPVLLTSRSSTAHRLSVALGPFRFSDHPAV